MAETINMPKLGFDMAEGTLVRWVKKEGETINKGDVLAEIETDKATVEVESSASGVVRKLLVDEGAVVPISTPIAVVGTAEEKIELPAAAPAESKPSTAPAAAPEKTSNPVPQPAPAQASTLEPPSTMIKASPLAKRLAQEQNVDLTNIQGSGPGGRVVRRDIEKALSGQQVPVNVAPITPAQPVVLPGIQLSDQTVPMSKLRQSIARRMTASKTTIPHFYVTHEFKVGALIEMRKQVNATLGENEKISVNDFIIKAVALTLHQFPNLNASLEGNAFKLHGSVNIGVAVSVEGGLLTVVCKDADLKTLSRISAEVKSMAARVRQGKIRSEEIEGSTFSISNMGMYEVENFNAIINPPEAAILAVGSAREVPVVEAGEVKPGWRMKATIAVDHRISDGAEAAKFMQALAIYLETPLKMFI
jgi:pyruvate dehydrogenase E2 component (dihydrolipoamide acetyltransferase)